MKNAIKLQEALKNHLRFEPTSSAMAKWDQGVQAAARDEKKDNSISILDVIGVDFWTGEGVTAKRIAAALRSIGDGDVVVNINSPGGDMFEGIAIYNLLKEHPGKVTVKILGIAASAASIIAMAGNEIQIAKTAFLMLHNSWVVAAGNRHDLRAVADYLEPFDEAMRDVYVARTGADEKTIAAFLDAESWINGSNAVDGGFADAFLPSDAVKSDEKAQAGTLDSVMAKRELEKIAAKLDLAPRSKIRELVKAIEGGTPGAATTGTQDAAGSSTQDAAATVVNPAALIQLELASALFKTKTKS